MSVRTLLLVAAPAIAVIALAVWLWTPDLPRPELEARYLRAPGDMMEIGGVRLHVRDSGPRDAPAVILLHGFGASLHTWEPWAAALQDRWRVVRFDLPGAGLSPPDPTGRYTDARTVELMLALMDRLGVGRAALIGNSIGGRAAWRFAADHPDRVSRLVLVSPDGFASPGFAYGQAPKVSAALSAMRYVLPKPLLRANLAPAYGDPAALTAPILDRYHDLMRAPGVRAALIARMEQTVLEDPVPRLRRIAAPVLLVWGEKDALIPFANAADYQRALPQSRLVAFPGLGHMPQEEAPAASIGPVRAFLAEGEAP